MPLPDRPGGQWPNRAESATIGGKGAKMADRDPAQAPTEKRINAILGDLIAQRQLLESSPVTRELLAANGASIAYWQSKLRHASAQHRPRPH